MAESYTLARPYAEAVYELAEAADNGLALWSGALAALSAIVSNETVAKLLGNPRVSDDALVEAIIAVGGDDFNEGARRLVRVLVANGRLRLAPQIAELFEARRAAAEHRLDVEITSAVALSESQRKALGDALREHFDRDVSMRYEQDAAIIGGIVVRAGDLVIDGSLAAQLERMRQSLAH